jgi:hypothetical protein
MRKAFQVATALEITPARSRLVLPATWATSSRSSWAIAWLVVTIPVSLGCGNRMTSHYVARPTRKIAYYRCTRTFHLAWGMCSLKQVNADKVEALVMEAIDRLSASPDLIERAIASANEGKDSRTAPLRAREDDLANRERALKSEAENVLSVLRAQGAAGLALVQAELARLEGDTAIVTHELRTVRAELAELRHARVDAGRAAALVKDFWLLYKIAKPEERRELIRLVFKRITYNGPDKPLGFELFDRDSVNLPPEGSKLSPAWLQRQDSNLGPGG